MKLQLITATAAFALLVPALASAQSSERTYLEQGVPAPSQALELTVGTGYTQGFGKLDSATSFPQVAHAGLGIDFAAGYRINPHWALSLGGQYQELNPDHGGDVRGATGTLAAQYHIAPMTRVDPWLELGSGYRALWIVPPDNTARATVMSHGFQLVRARAGFDVRVSPDIAFSPVIGADLTTFVWQDTAGGSNVAISDPTVSTFVFAGVQGRFDLGGNKVGVATLTSAPGYDY